MTTAPSFEFVTPWLVALGLGVAACGDGSNPTAILADDGGAGGTKNGFAGANDAEPASSAGSSGAGSEVPRSPPRLSDVVPITLYRSQALGYCPQDGQAIWAEITFGPDDIPVVNAKLHRGWLGDSGTDCMCLWFEQPPIPCEWPECELTEWRGPIALDAEQTSSLESLIAKLPDTPCELDLDADGHIDPCLVDVLTVGGIQHDLVLSSLMCKGDCEPVCDLIDAIDGLIPS